jgi:tRNA dimethylallyltransferase
MASAGALNEVRTILARTLSSDLPALKAVGLRELARHVGGAITLEVAIREAQQASRRYAKRQMTWLRTQLPPPDELPTHLVHAQYSESLLPEIFSFIRQHLLTASPQAV